ncbi:MAG: KUP/HAK/KT family potassium transporter, partial [Duncaniella sp.]|nr:KUP/HAK/KT family potassium transporter [Duncaniella sp.]
MKPSASHAAAPSSLHRLSALGLLVTMGIVFGDIGTSPLYVMKAIMGGNPDYDADYIIGAVSCVIWTLTLQTTLKYVVIALRADNKGEGGILALYSLLRRRGARWLYVVAAIGAAALIADGVITPAMTVTSAIEGLAPIDPSIPVVPIVIAIISLIFLMQRAGTGNIGRLFGPYMLVWFLMLGIMGAVSVHLCPAILKAFNPWYAVRLLVAYPGWFMVLGAVFLCTTGAEALYSDLGHCGRLNIAVSWIFVKVMLILNYLGQGAWMIARRGDIDPAVNPFYGIMPDWFVVPGVVMSACAAVIASQALLSGSFTIFSEAMGLDFWPRMVIKHTSDHRGQLYIPAVNLALYAGCIVTVLVFRSSAHMEAAYGLAITVTMLMTTVLLAVYLRLRRAPGWVVGIFLGGYVALEGCFFVANMFKFAHGGWFTMLIAGIVCFVMIGWRKAVRVRRSMLEYVRLDDYAGVITDLKADTEIPKYASNLIYLSGAPADGTVESKIIYSIINKQPKRADHYWMIHIDYTDEPDTLEYE